MACIVTTATIKNTLTTTATLGGLLAVSTILSNQINASVVIPTTSKLTAGATITSALKSTVKIINSGVNGEACPIILCIDGGNAFTTVYPPVNGLLNGGSA